MKFVIDTTRLAAVESYLDEMGGRVADLSVPFTSAAKLLQADVEEQISSGGLAFGEAWAPKSLATIERHGNSPLLSTLVRDLYYFVRPQLVGVASRNPLLNVIEAGRDWPQVGGKIEMPKRVVFGYKEETIDAIIDLITGYAVEGEVSD